VNTKNGKVPGLNTISPELLKDDTDLTANILCSLFGKIWEQEKIPEEWSKGPYLNYQRKEMFFTVQIGEELHYFL
jgi:hypothetical protein